MSEPPKLFTHKPKKVKGNVAKGVIPPPASSPPPPSSSAKPSVSVPVKESFARRYKFLWPLLLGVNVAVGAYLYMRTTKKDASGVERAPAAVAGPSTELVSGVAPTVAENTVPSATTTTLPVSTPAATPVAENTAPSATTTTLPVSTPVAGTTSSLPIAASQSVRDTVSVDQQRELFKWILDEKRKIKPKDVEEKKCIDSEKAVLKQFIRAKSVPII